MPYAGCLWYELKPPAAAMERLVFVRRCLASKRRGPSLPLLGAPAGAIRNWLRLIDAMVCISMERGHQRILSRVRALAGSCCVGGPGAAGGVHASPVEGGVSRNLRGEKEIPRGLGDSAERATRKRVNHG